MTLHSVEPPYHFYISIKSEDLQISFPIYIQHCLYWNTMKGWERAYLTGLCSSNSKILNGSAPLLSVSCWEKNQTKTKQKENSEIYSEQNKKGETVAEELGICTNPQRERERGGERDSCRILTQNMLACQQKVSPNTTTTPTTWIAAALHHLLTHVFKQA